MEAIDSIMTSWTTFFVNAIIWYVIGVVFYKWTEGQVTIKNLFGSLFFAVLSPVFSLMVIIAIALIPFIFLIVWAEEEGWFDKKLF